MKTAICMVSLGLGMAVGAVAVLMLPHQNPTRRRARKVAHEVEDAVSDAADALESL